MCGNFTRLNNEKLKACIFDGPQIWQLMRHQKFCDSMDEADLDGWSSLNLEKYEHFLYSHLDQFPENLGDVNNEKGKRFNQNIKTIKGNRK